MKRILHRVAESLRRSCPRKTPRRPETRPSASAGGSSRSGHTAIYREVSENSGAAPTAACPSNSAVGSRVWRRTPASSESCSKCFQRWVLVPSLHLPIEETAPISLSSKILLYRVIIEGLSGSVFARNGSGMVRLY